MAWCLEPEVNQLHLETYILLQFIMVKIAVEIKCIFNGDKV